MSVEAKPKVAYFTGYVKVDGHRQQVDFSAPMDATPAQKDSIFLNALAQVAEVDYLEVGQD